MQHAQIVFNISGYIHTAGKHLRSNIKKYVPLIIYILIESKQIHFTKLDITFGHRYIFFIMFYAVLWYAFDKKLCGVFKTQK